jgi:hypothetical protein
MTQQTPNHTPGNPRGAAIVVVVGMFVGICWSIWIDVQGRFATNREVIGVSRYVTGVDPYLTDAAAGGGLYLRFVGFDGHGDYAANYYFRANYILFPQRVLVGDPSDTINTATQILAANSPRDESWFLAHGVPTVLTIYCRPNPIKRSLDFLYQVHRIPAATTR